MKKILFLPLTFALIFSSCSSDTDSSPQLVIPTKTNTSSSSPKTNESSNTEKSKEKNDKTENPSSTPSDKNTRGTDDGKNTSNQEENTSSNNESTNTSESSNNGSNQEQNTSNGNNNTSESSNNENTSSSGNENPSAQTPTEPIVPSYYLKLDYNETFHWSEITFQNEAVDITGYIHVRSINKIYGRGIVWSDGSARKQYIIGNINGTQYTIKNLKCNDELYDMNFGQHGNGKIYELSGNFIPINGGHYLEGYTVYIDGRKIIVTPSKGVYSYIDTLNGYLVIINTNQ